MSTLRISVPLDKITSKASLVDVLRASVESIPERAIIEDFGDGFVPANDVEWSIRNEHLSASPQVAPDSTLVPIDAPQEPDIASQQRLFFQLAHALGVQLVEVPEEKSGKTGPTMGFLPE